MNIRIANGKIFKAKDGNIITLLSVEENGIVNYSIENDDKVYTESRDIVKSWIAEEVL